MNLPPRWVPVLKDEGWDAVHWSSIGAPGAADAEILRYAKKGGYAVLTHDLDFGAILAATGGNAPSVIQVRTQDVFPEAIGPLVCAAVRQFKGEIENGVLISVDENRSRARLLPLWIGVRSTQTKHAIQANRSHPFSGLFDGCCFSKWHFGGSKCSQMRMA